MGTRGREVPTPAPSRLHGFGGMARPARHRRSARAKHSAPHPSKEKASRECTEMDKANTADMVKDAIKTLGERGGSSLHNIKKYIEAVYQVDMRYRAPRIRKFLRDAVSEGDVVQTSGKGASGSFRLPPRQQPAATAATGGKALGKAPRRHRTASSAPRRATPRPVPRAAPSSAAPRRRGKARASTASTASSTSTVASAASTVTARDARAKARASRHGGGPV